MIAIGATEISKVCLGSAELSKVCLGSTELWSSAPPTAQSYVQDGLVAMWDGLENVGYGQRDTTSLVWKNLQGNTDWDMVVPAAWNEQGMYFDGTWCGKAPKTPLLEVTIECVYAGGGILAVGWSYGGSRSSRMSILNNSSINLLRGYLTNDNVFDGTFNANTKHLALTVSNSRKTGEMYVNGVANTTQTFGTSLTATTNNRFRLSGYGSSSDGDSSGMFYTGTIYRCSIYNRKLTAEEIAANYQIDKLRYGI